MLMSDVMGMTYTRHTAFTFSMAGWNKILSTNPLRVSLYWYLGNNVGVAVAPSAGGQPLADPAAFSIVPHNIMPFQWPLDAAVTTMEWYASAANGIEIGVVEAILTDEPCSRTVTGNLQTPALPSPQQDYLQRLQDLAATLGPQPSIDEMPVPDLSPDFLGISASGMRLIDPRRRRMVR